MSLVVLNSKNSFSVEQNFFEEKKTELLKKFKNKFVLIKKKMILGTYNSAEEAYKDGLKKIGNKPMFIKHIVEKEPNPLLMGIL